MGLLHSYTAGFPASQAGNWRVLPKRNGGGTIVFASAFPHKSIKTLLPFYYSVVSYLDISKIPAKWKTLKKFA